jgi:hypothetical protein
MWPMGLLFKLQTWNCFSQLFKGIVPQVQKGMRAYHVPFGGALFFIGDMHNDYAVC